MWLVKYLDICDFDVIGFDVHPFDDENKAKDFFKQVKKKVKETFAKDKKEYGTDWLIDTDDDNMLDAWVSDSYASDKVKVILEEKTFED